MRGAGACAGAGAGAGAYKITTAKSCIKRDLANALSLFAIPCMSNVVATKL